jgi:hypothetical protein
VNEYKFAPMTASLLARKGFAAPSLGPNARPPEWESHLPPPWAPRIAGGTTLPKAFDVLSIAPSANDAAPTLKLNGAAMRPVAAHALAAADEEVIQPTADERKQADAVEPQEPSPQDAKPAKRSASVSRQHRSSAAQSTALPAKPPAMDPAPDPAQEQGKARRVMVQVTAGELERLAIAAIKKGKSRHEIVREALDAYFAKLAYDFPAPCQCLMGMKSEAGVDCN